MFSQKGIVMRGTFNIIIATILLIGAVSCLEIDTHISVKGDGQLNENSNLGIAKDHVNAAGEQTYDRYYSNKGSRMIFVDNYNLTKPSAKGSRNFAISTMLPEGIGHYMKLTSESTMSTINSVDRNVETGQTTRFRASTLGTLEESIFDLSAVARPKFIADMDAKGDITFFSGVKSNATTAGTDLERLLTSLDSVQMYSETARIQIPIWKTQFILGNESVTVSEGSKGTYRVGGTEFSYKVNPSSDMNEEDQINTIKEKGVSESRNVGIYRVIKEVPNAEYLDVDINPTEARIGDLVDFQIHLYKNGDARLYRVSATAKLPNEINYIESPYGIYNNGHINWENIGPLNGNQSVNLAFGARINENAAKLSGLNITAHAEGIYQDGEPQQGDETVTITIRQPFRKCS
jgi:hypothetical protein